MSISSKALELWQFSFIRYFTRNPEFGNTPVWVLPNIWRLGQVGNTKVGTNFSNKLLRNAANATVTAFSVSELLRVINYKLNTAFHFPKIHIFETFMTSICDMDEKIRPVAHETKSELSKAGECHVLKVNDHVIVNLNNSKWLMIENIRKVWKKQVRDKISTCKVIWNILLRFDVLWCLNIFMMYWNV